LKAAWCISGDKLWATGFPKTANILKSDDDMTFKFLVTSYELRVSDKGKEVFLPQLSFEIRNPRPATLN
jgi:hypothetical protein